MKSLILIFVVSLMSVAAYSQNAESMLNQYLHVKDALIQSDSKVANQYVVLLQKEIEMSGSFKEKESLLKAVQKMANETDIEKQRGAFADVSITMWKIVQHNSEIKEAVYYQYCPMKNAYWLSKTASIKNPYYDSKMMTCGKVSDKNLR